MSSNVCQSNKTLCYMPADIFRPAISLFCGPLTTSIVFSFFPAHRLMSFVSLINARSSLGERVLSWLMTGTMAAVLLSTISPVANHYLVPCKIPQPHLPLEAVFLSQS